MTDIEPTPSLKEYWDSVHYFCTLCRQTLREDFVSLIVVGSLGVGDAIPGWSDVDAYFIVRETSGRIDGIVTDLVRRVTERHSFLSTDRGSKFTVFTYGRREFLEGGQRVSFLAQWDARRHGVVACGEDLASQIDEAPLDREWLARHTEWMIDFLEREREAPDRWKWVNAIGFVLAGARVAVLKEGTYAKRKEDVLRHLKRLHPGHEVPVANAMEFRLRWPRIPGPDQVESYRKEGIRFLQWVRNLQ